MIASDSDFATDLRDRVAAGDRAALGMAFERYRLFALKVLHENGRALADLDDLVQDAFVLLPKCAEHCDRTTSLAGCVVTAVKQAIRGFDNRSATSDQTQHGQQTRRVALPPAVLFSIPDAAWSPEEVLELRERVHHLSELLLQMPSRERSVLIAREANGMSAREVAERFGIKLASVATLGTKARRRLEELAKTSPLADIFAAMPKRGALPFQGSSRSSRWRRKRAAAQLKA